MLWQGLTTLLSHWWRHRLQLAMLLLGLALATALWSAVQAINTEARLSYARAAAVIGQDRLAALVSADGAPIPQNVYVRLRQAGWLVSPVLEGDLRLGNYRLRLLGIDPLTLPPDATQIDVGAADIGLESFILPPGLLVVAPETAARLAGEATLPLRIREALPPGLALADIGIAQRLLQRPWEITRLLLWPRQIEGLQPLAQLAPGLVPRPPSRENDLSRLTDSFHLNLTAFGFLAFAVGLFIVHAAIGLAYEQRRPMLRTLRALGLPLPALVVLSLVELLALSVMAGLLGVALGYAVAAVLLPDVAASLRGLYGADVPGQLSLSPSVWGLGLALAVTGTLVSASLRLWRIATMPLLAPAQPRAWSRASTQSLALQALAGVALLGLSAFAVMFGHGLAAGFAGLGAMLLGAALVLPLLLSLLLAMAGRSATGPVAQWFWADTRQQLPGLSLALMALLLALSANAGVGAMVGSFRLTFVGWLDQRLASELYVTARSSEEADRMRDWLASRSDAVLPIWSAEDTILGRSVQLYGLRDHATYRKNWPLLAAAPDVWDRLSAGTGLIVNEQMARRTQLGLEDRVRLRSGRELAVSGIYSDYGNPKDQAMIGVDLLVELHPEVNRQRFAIRVAPDKVAGLASELQDAFSLGPDNVIDQAGIKAFSLRIFERTFAITAALNVLTLGVAALAMFASLLTLVEMRLAQLAPAWAMGLTLRQLALLEILRSVTLAAFTTLAAVPVGLALAWLLLAVINVEAFGWRLPMHFFPSDWLWLGMLSLLSAGLAAILPALKLLHRPPAALLKVFANER
ncbi:FtsX-like permease family protein [Aestuariivirga sp.]|jgi:putative ABC transport system permease protein|uniref:ABC transporter permease n=1 Tax=Aestuariivirga sp. TaxID=2650926 RepID=UPI003785267B